MITACAALTSAACATGTGVVGAVSIAEPGPVEGDETAIAWPFVVTHGGGPEILADFHLRIDDGGTLLAVRPDSQNPDPDARFVWRGEVRGDEGYWIGDVLPSGGQVRLVAMVRPEMDDGRILLRVVHWPTNGQDEAVGPETCEVWTYETDGQRLEQEEC
ncbi:MAG: hypothetical protein KY397_01140 [Gemmatimonadetes bacterium]|nr:hypothetical protein [Gemmatimonadota bacterium]